DMKSIKFIWLLIVLIFTSCAKDDLKLNKEKCYLVFRESDSKEGFFVKKFNLGNSKVTHVGFLIYNEMSWKVFHAINKNGNCIEQIEFDDFCDSGKRKLHLEFLEILDFNSKTKLVSKIDSIKKCNLKFDYSFSNTATKSIYCSRFVCKILEATDSDKYHFDLREKKLNAIESSFLNKERLLYYPVDIFLFDRRFKRIHIQ
ncbi:MAG TPA: hypothetical protein VLB74_01530, partial [Flavobacterium sp.]|uniref:hypothetical protein n=1 Tax=Flavobacterium sp. TaxID=239 RepID=UPI002D13F4ED